ncbi:MAG: hypothetical protein B6226_01670 [Candidatus Cloacimonetes bacterium 4572_65]|nr:MAG: hypothetical protein B6226_01670 [Candidatus Cloacimonetes bacterium 4572_65]
MELKKFKLILIMLVITISLVGMSVSDYHAKIVATYDAIESYSADINQMNHFVELDIKRESVGKIFYNDENLLLSYTSPQREKILFKGLQISLYQPEEAILIKTIADSSVVSLNLKELINQFWSDEVVSIVSEENNVTKLLLDLSINNSSVSQIEKIYLYLNRDSWLVEAVSYSDKTGNLVTIEFSNIKLNAPLKSDLWHLDIAKDTQVIDYR